jgi:3-methyladenine DNA glycosylase AlkD
LRFQKLIADLRKSVEDMTGTKSPSPDKKFHKHDEYVSYGLNVPGYRKLMESFRPRFLKLSWEERLTLSQELLGTHIGELSHVGIYILYTDVKELSPRDFAFLDRIMEDFRSWSHVDHLCGGVLQPLLLEYRKDTLAQLVKWNSSRNRFKRRASVVTFVRKIGESGEFTQEVLKLCKNLIWDEEDIVLKGVGWALKDNLRSAPDQVIPFVKKLRRQGVSSTVTLYAIRDLKGKAREKVLTVKKAKSRD